MDHPVKDIRFIIRTLTSGLQSDLCETISKYYTPTASLSHPFVRVPSFSTLPFAPDFTSRTLILAIYKWYRLLSPHTTIEIESTVFDQRTNLLYVTLTQRFAIWFLPFHRSPVRLVTVLHLVSDSTSGQQNSQQQNGHITSGVDTPALGQADDEPSFAEVANSAVDTSGAVEKNGTSAVRRKTSLSRSSSGGGGRKYRIAKQEDLYQVNEFLKFVLMAPGAMVWGWWQLLSAMLCVVGVLVLEPVMRLVGTAEGRSRAVFGNGSANGRRM